MELMQKGYRAKVRTHCTECRMLVIISRPGQPPFTADEVSKLQVGYICSDCDTRTIAEIFGEES